MMPPIPDRRPSTPRTFAARLAAALLVTAGLVFATAPATAQDEPSSTRYVLSQSTVNSGGASAVSPNFVLDGSTSQPATVGEAGSASYRLQSGFWTSLSTLAVLRVATAGSGSGSVTEAPIIGCSLAAGSGSGDCLEQVVHGTELSLVAVPAAASSFDGWSGCDGVSTTVLPGDTCTVRLISSRTVTTTFILLATVDSRIWRDLDGDGIEDPGEPGIDGVGVTLTGGGAVTRTTTTVGGGLYGFTDVPPGTYSVSVDTATLPPGVVPSFDLDGIATAHTTRITLTDGQALDGADFGYQPLVDLALAKESPAITFPPDGRLVYTLTVTNLGPAEATGVVVTDLLPDGLTPGVTVGCAEDPVGYPDCSLGDLAPGAMASYTLEVTGDPAALPAITNTAMVVAAEVDTDPGNDLASVDVAATPVVEIPVSGPVGLALLALLMAALGWGLVPGRSRLGG